MFWMRYGLAADSFRYNYIFFWLSTKIVSNYPHIRIYVYRSIETAAKDEFRLIHSFIRLCACIACTNAYIYFVEKQLKIPNSLRWKIWREKEATGSPMSQLQKIEDRNSTKKARTKTSTATRGAKNDRENTDNMYIIFDNRFGIRRCFVSI